MLLRTGIKIFLKKEKKGPCLSLKLLLTMDRFRLGGATLKFLQLFFRKSTFHFQGRLPRFRINQFHQLNRTKHAKPFNLELIHDELILRYLDSSILLSLLLSQLQRRVARSSPCPGPWRRFYKYVPSTRPTPFVLFSVNPSFVVVRPLSQLCPKQPLLPNGLFPDLVGASTRLV